MKREDLEAMGEDLYPDVAAMHEERRELFRIAGQSALDRSDGGRTMDPEARKWAAHWAQQKPLGRPLSDGVAR